MQAHECFRLGLPWFVSFTSCSSLLLSCAASALNEKKSAQQNSTTGQAAELNCEQNCLRWWIFPWQL